MIFSTTDNLEGYRITEYCGVINNAGRMLNGPFAAMEKAAFAASPKANAVIGIRPWGEKDLLGTAVVVEKI